MRRWMLYGLALLIVSMLPSRGYEIGRLEPAGLLYIYEEDGIVTVQTDTGSLGRGADFAQAVEDLQHTADSVIYLDTVEFAVLSPEARDQLPALRDALRGNTALCIAREQVDPAAAYSYLRIHRPERGLRQQNGQIPELIREEGRYRLENTGNG